MSGGASPIMQRLIQIPIFRGLTESEATAVFGLSQETQVQKGETLFSEGDAGDALYVVLDGHVDILKKDRGGREQPLAKMGDGSVLGEMSLVAGGAARSATARAVTELKLLKISSHAFSMLVRQDNVGALKIIHNLAQVLARRLLLMDEKLVDLVDQGKKREELAEFQRILANWSF